MREEVRMADGTLVGWKDTDGSGTVRVYGADGDYKGYADDTGTYDSRDGFIMSGKHPDMLLSR